MKLLTKESDLIGKTISKVEIYSDTAEITFEDDCMFELHSLNDYECSYIGIRDYKFSLDEDLLYNNITQAEYDSGIKAIEDIEADKRKIHDIENIKALAKRNDLYIEIGDFNDK